MNVEGSPDYGYSAHADDNRNKLTESDQRYVKESLINKDMELYKEAVRILDYKVQRFGKHRMYRSANKWPKF